MDFQTAPPLPPPLPPFERDAADDATTKSPPLGITLGFIALYFVMQLVVGALLGLMVGAGYYLTRISRGEAAAPDIFVRDMESLLSQPSMQAWLTILVLAISATITLSLARRQWAVLWPIAQPPGFGFTRPTTPLYIIIALLLGLSVPLAGSWLTQLFAGSQTVPQDIQQLGAHTSLAGRIALAALLVSLGPLVEELLFRGMLLSALMRRWRAPAAVVASSLIFAMVHLPGLQYHWYALPALLLLALVLAWLRLKSGSIWPAVLAHGVNNALAVAGWFVVWKP